MATAILKLSFNRRGDSSFEGGLCGSGFLVSSNIMVTAHHCLNRDTFAPNRGYLQAMVWAIGREGWVREIRPASTSLHPDVDATIVTFSSPIPNATVYGANREKVPMGQAVQGLTIRSGNLNAVQRDEDGSVSRTLSMTVEANDIKIQDVPGMQLSFPSQVGMSGGPVLENGTNRVLGMMSLGLPPDVAVKTDTFAVSIDAIFNAAEIEDT